MTIDALDVGWEESTKTSFSVPNLTKGEQRVLNMIRKDNHATAQSIADDLCISQRAVQLHLKSLKTKEVIKRDGSDKTGIWVIIQHYEGEQ